MPILSRLFTSASCSANARKFAQFVEGLEAMHRILIEERNDKVAGPRSFDRSRDCIKQ